MQHQVTIKGSRNGLVIPHAKLEEKIQGIVGLGKQDAFASSNDLDSQEVMKLVHIFHLKLPKEEHLNLVDVSNVFITNYQVIHTYVMQKL